MKLRTENLFSTSAVTLPNYPLKVLPQSSHRQDFCFLPLSHSVSVSLSSVSLSLPVCVCIYIYILSLPVTPPLTLTPSLSISLSVFVPPYSSLSTSIFWLAFLTFSLLLLLLTISCVSPVQSTVDIMSLTSQLGSRWEFYGGAYYLSTDAVRLQWDLCTALSILLRVFWLVHWVFSSYRQ